MKKFSIIINHAGNDKYEVVCKSWALDNEGNEINIKNFVAVNKSINEAIVIAENFVR